MQAYYIMRKDLEMSPAKLAVEVGHGTCLLSRKLQSPTYTAWIEDYEMKKIVCEVSSEEKLNNIYDRLDEIINSGLFTRQQYRHEFVGLYNTLEQINTHIKATKTHKKHADTVERLQNNDIKAFKEKLKEKQAKEKARLEKNLTKVFKELPTFSERCIYAFGDWVYNFSFNISDEDQNKLHSDLKKYLQPDNSISVIWFDGDYLETSQSIRLDKVECAAMIRLWKKDKFKHGMTIGGYTVLEVQKDYVKIGCHKITTENLQELYKELTNTATIAA